MTSPTVLSAGTYLSHIRADAARMRDVAGRGLDAEEPACPDWKVQDALGHTGEVYSHKVACMRSGRPQSRADWEQPPERSEELLHWFGVRSAELIAELEQRGPDAPAYTWYEPQQNAGFWFRRMAQETVIHRVDIESAFDEVSPVDDALAVDGIDEVLDLFLAYQADDVGPDGPGKGAVVVRTGEYVWRVTLTPDDVEFSRGPGPFDAVVGGEASELLLWLWGRRPDAAVAIEGDRALVEAMRARLQIVTQ